MALFKPVRTRTSGALLAVLTIYRCRHHRLSQCIERTLDEHHRISPSYVDRARMRRRFSYGYHLVLDCCFQAVAWCLSRNDTMAENEGKEQIRLRDAHLGQEK